VKLILAFSIVLNVALASVLFNNGAEDTALIPVTSIAHAPAYNADSENKPFPRAIGELHDYFENLLAEGLGYQQTKPLVLAKLKQDYIHSIKQPEDRYWEDRPLAQINYLLQIFQGFLLVREGLLAIYDVPVIHDPLFSEIFYPLAMQYPFLSSEQQLTIQSVQLDTQKLAIESQMNSTNGIAMLSGEQSPANVLAKTLNERALEEYLLRSSPLANTMRRSDVIFTEANFRQAFSILSRLQQVQEPQDIFEARDDINDLLGPVSGIALWAAIDPTFRSLKLVADRHVISDEQALSVYEVLLNSNQALSEAAQDRQNDPDSAIRAIQEIVKERQNELIQLVGDKAAIDFIAATRGGGAQRLNRQPNRQTGNQTRYFSPF
jgi:hypothetical protein